jgi:hypothetical protein
MIVSILAYISASIGTLGQWADGFTTYQGVKKFGPSIESNKSWFAQFLVAHPSTLLYLKPVLFAASEYALIWAGPYTNTGGFILALAFGAIAAAMGFDAAYGNYKVNSAK